VQPHHQAQRERGCEEEEEAGGDIRYRSAELVDEEKKLGTDHAFTFPSSACRLARHSRQGSKRFAIGYKPKGYFSSSMTGRE
jgi:hypothetical protein